MNETATPSIPTTPRRRLLKLSKDATATLTDAQLETLAGGRAGTKIRPPDSNLECDSIVPAACSAYFC